MSGFTYDHRYWDPGTGRQNSYVQAAIDAGSAVYNVDRIGVGDSDTAPAAQLDVDAEAYVAHQLVRALHSGTLGAFRDVVGIGHSYGSAIWMVESSRYHDLDAVVLTGLLHQANSTALNTITATMYPASSDPAFAHHGLPDGYLTTMPGTRQSDFYYLPGADPAMIALDERTKATGTSGELGSIAEFEDPAVSGTMRLPVLLVVGDHDTLVCEPTAGLTCDTGTEICARERPYYPPDSPLYAATIARSGHSINLHRSAPAEFTIANRWIEQTTSGAPARGGATRCAAATGTSPAR